MAQVTIGRDPATGKPRRATFYGKTRQDVADKLTKALRDKQQGTLVAPHKLTLGEWLQTWLWEYKAARGTSSDGAAYEMIVRRHRTPALGHIALQDPSALSTSSTPSTPGFRRRWLPRPSADIGSACERPCPCGKGW